MLFLLALRDWKLPLALAVFPALLLAAASSAYGQTETVLHFFCSQPNCADGASPQFVTPVLDENGNLYGTTATGGTYGYGTVFEMTPSGTETVLYSFADGWTDGSEPWAGLVRDNEGNLFGMTCCGGSFGLGTVFKVTPSGVETILHTFGASGDGAEPYNSGLIQDAAGNLYGTTQYGGAHPCCGTVFKVTPTGTEIILHSFSNAGRDGYSPSGSLVMDKHGNLYGTTFGGGDHRYGTVFKLTPSGTEKILYSFSHKEWALWWPVGPLVLDAEGNLYGVTAGGGNGSCKKFGCGTVFKLTPSGTRTILHRFSNNGTDGWFPWSGLVWDAKGNLYGTTKRGGSQDSGTVFELTPQKHGWTETILWSFNDYDPYGKDGAGPLGGLVLDKNGNLYGTTSGGGPYPYFGTLFRVTP